MTNIDLQKGTLAGGFSYSAAAPTTFQRGDVDGVPGVQVMSLCVTSAGPHRTVPVMLVAPTSKYKTT